MNCIMCTSCFVSEMCVSNYRFIHHIESITLLRYASTPHPFETKKEKKEKKEEKEETENRVR